MEMDRRFPGELGSSDMTVVGMGVRSRPVRMSSLQSPSK